MRFSNNVASLVPSATLAISARAKGLRAQGLSIVDLSAGEPSFPTPEVAIAAGTEYVASGKAGYPPTPGTPELRAAVAAYVNETTAHGNATPSRVIVSAGVKQALFNISFCLFQAGDEILVPVPYWPTYLAIAELSGATPVVAPTAWEKGFQIDVDALDRCRTSNTRALFINSPGNPSGCVYGLDRLRSVCAWAEQHDIWVISDEIYRRLYYEGGSAPSVLDLEQQPANLVHLDGVSKAFSMPGWRIGYAVAPEELVAKATALQSQTTSGAAGPSQKAAAAILASRERETIVSDFRSKLDRRRLAAVEALRGLPGLDVTAPAGSIYLFVRLADTEDSVSVAEALLEEAGVACIPGEPFGTPGFLRLNYAVDDEELTEGLARLTSFFS